MSVFEIRYGTSRHQKLLDAILQRHRYSYNAMSQKYDTFRKLEELDLAYLPETEADQLRRDKRESGKPQYTTITVPYSYAIKQSAHMYLASVFLSRAPVHQFSGQGAETQSNELAVETLIDYQIRIGGSLGPYYVWLHDMLKYGFGVLGTYWDKEVSYVSSIEERPKLYMGIIPIPGKTQKVRTTRQIDGYNGNRSYNVSPYEIFPDPRVPLSQLQSGEFIGRMTQTGWNEIIKRKKAGRYYNVEVLSLNKTANFFPDAPGNRSSQIIMPENTDSITIGQEEKVSIIRLLEFYWEIIPSDWGLGESNYPEKWVFTVANGAIIVSAQPMGLLHNKFPFDVLESDFDGYALIKRSLLEVSKPLNDVMTWLVNAHFHNVRKVLNDQLVVDPSRVVMKDLTDPDAGRLIRLKPAAYGTDTRLAVSQLQVVDITRSHISDMQVISDLMQRATGVVDSLMGMLDPGGRKTATEVRQAGGFSANRLKTIAEYCSATGISTHARKLLQSSQQLYDINKKLRIMNNQLANGVGVIDITPESIAGEYDYVPIDGTMPIDRTAQMALWGQTLQQLAAIPQAQMYDFERMIDYTIKLGGIRNLSSFKVQVVPDAQMASAAAAGNVIPLRGQGGQANQAGTEGSIPGAPTIAGMGPVA